MNAIVRLVKKCNIKPFAVKIKKALEDGTAKYVKTSGKHIYLYGLRGAVDKSYYT